MAIVVQGSRGRVYLPPSTDHDKCARSAVPKWKPEVDMNVECKDLVSGRGYGFTKWHEIFTSRQLAALTTFSDLVSEARQRLLADTKKTDDSTETAPLANSAGTVAYADAVATYLGLCLGRLADASTSLTRWKPSMDQAIATFGRQALPMVWDFAESNVFNGFAGDYSTSLGTILRVISVLPARGSAHVVQLDATTLNITGPQVISSDPPYYDNISYADLSDFFYIWLRRSLLSIYPSLFATLLTPKTQELIASSYRHNGSRENAQAFFEGGLGRAFACMRTFQATDYPLTVYYAFKQAETDAADEDESDSEPGTASTGWETMLQGLIRSDFCISGTWPMRTELGNRMVGMGTNALASSIVLVCRPRPGDAPLATRKQFLTALRQELPDALRNLQHGNIAPVDLAQAAIGPGMAVFTRYAKVMETNGNAMTVRAALGLINQSLDEVLAEQEGEFDAETRWALSWFDEYGMDEGPFGVAETLSKAKNTAVNALVETGILMARGGKVRLLKREELAEGWDPATDPRLRQWEIAQYLIRTLEQKGEAEAATLVGKLGGNAETARDLAYRLYSICEPKKWANEALAYNSLVIAWPELSKLAYAQRTAEKSTQPEMF